MVARSMTSLEVRIPSASFGAAEITGLVPERDVADAAARATARDALARYGVVCLAIADALDKATFRRVADMFGPIKNPIGRTRDGSELRYDAEMQIIDAGFVLTD